MFTVKKTFEIAGAHSLKLPYASKCSELHGHNWKITVWCRARKLNAEGMVVDFSEIKTRVQEWFDHRCLNDVLEQPTAERIAEFICNHIGGAFRVEVQESEGNEAIFERRANDL